MTQGLVSNKDLSHDDEYGHDVQHIFFILTVPNGPPLTVSARALSSQSVIITWEPPSPEEQNGHIVEYVINITGLDTGERYQHLSASNNLTIGLLSPFSTYTCVIAASTSVGIGPFSTVVIVQTLEDGVLSRCNFYQLELMQIY